MNEKPSFLSALLKVTLFSLLAASIAHGQGSLTPPGAPAPVMKTLDQVEPRKLIKNSDLPLTITQSGSYYLAEEIQFSTPDVDAITIACDKVTLDLNGFSMTGPWTSKSAPGKGSAIAIAPDKEIKLITLRNGTVTGWGGPGINLNRTLHTFPLHEPATSWQVRISEITASFNGGSGITAFALGTIDRCTAVSNRGHGIDVQFWFTISNCLVVDNQSGDGIVYNMGSLITGNKCVNNGIAASGVAAGIHGRVSSGGRNQVVSNTLEGNKNGVYVETADGNLITGNYVFNSQQENYHIDAANDLVGPIIERGNMLYQNAPNANFSVKY